MRGRSREDAHRGVGAQERDVPTASLDYCCVGKKGEEQLKILVARDGESKAAFAHVASRKGEGGEGVARAVAEDLDQLGYKRALLKGDQEPALKKLRSSARTLARRQLAKQQGG